MRNSRETTKCLLLIVLVALGASPSRSTDIAANPASSSPMAVDGIDEGRRRRAQGDDIETRRDEGAGGGVGLDNGSPADGETTALPPAVDFRDDLPPPLWAVTTYELYAYHFPVGCFVLAYSPDVAGGALQAEEVRNVTAHFISSYLMNHTASAVARDAAGFGDAPVLEGIEVAVESHHHDRNKTYVRYCGEASSLTSPNGNLASEEKATVLKGLVQEELASTNFTSAVYGFVSTNVSAEIDTVEYLHNISWFGKQPKPSKEESMPDGEMMSVTTDGSGVLTPRAGMGLVLAVAVFLFGL